MKKETLENIKLGVFAILGIGACLFSLNAQDQQVKADAIERCGSETNIQEHYTKQGDVYYSCIIEK